MQQAIPAKEYSLDERAERARGAAIAFLGVVVGVMATLLLSGLVVLQLIR
jgi:hypothetical protein